MEDQVQDGSSQKPVFPPGPGVRLILPVLVIILAGWLIFLPALSGLWLWDDNPLVSGNVHLRTWSGLAQIWSGREEWPLTMSLFWVEWQIWGDHPGGYHLGNLALHLACGLLVWRLFWRLGLRWAWLGGLLFVVHPLAVETGAWISETKNTFSLLFLLLSLLAWLDYDQTRGRWNYACSLLLYLASLLAKTSGVMLPAVLLLHAWWKRGRITRRDLVEIVPFFLVAAVLGILTCYQQHHQGLGATTQVSGGFIYRVATAPLAWLFYLGRFLAPFGYLPVYPRWADDWHLLAWLAVALTALLAGAWWVRRRGWERHAGLGLSFYTLNLLPVLGIVWMKYLNTSPVADHLAYLPMIGLIGLALAALGQIDVELAPPVRPWFITTITAGVLGLGALSRSEAGLFVDHQTLWVYTLQRNPNAWPALNELGNDLIDDGRIPEAMALYQRALQLDPENPDLLNNLGNTQARTGHFDDALQQYQAALGLDPNMVNAHIDLGNVYLQTGRLDDAINQYQLALGLDPDNVNAHYNLGNALQEQGHFPEAIEQYQLVLDINPGHAAAWTNLGAALQQSGHIQAALDDYERALQLDPASAEAHASLGSALEQMDRPADAIAQYEQALQIDPDLADARNNLNQLLEAQKKAPAPK